MIANDFLDYLNKFQVTTYVGVEDFSDRYHFLFTVIVLLLCTTIVTVRQYVLSPISCYLANDVGGSNTMDYVDNYCWVEGTIPMTTVSHLPTDHASWTELEKYKIMYYQWVPFILGIQCIICYIPRLFWQIVCYSRTGTDIQHIVASANQAVHSSEEARLKLVQYLARSIEQILFQHRDNRSGALSKFRRKLHHHLGLLVFSKRLGTWVVLTYFFVKLLYLTTGFLHLLIMQKILGFTDNNIINFGSTILNNFRNGKDWRHTLVFPRVGYCRVQMRHVASAQQVALAQCVLPANMLNEKIYVFLWVWVLAGLLLTSISIPLWLFRLVHRRTRRRLLRKLLLAAGGFVSKATTPTSPSVGTSSRLPGFELLGKFEKQFLRHDGVFLIWMICINVGDIIAADILTQLWHIFKTNYLTRNLLNDGSDSDPDTGAMIKLASLTPSAPKSEPITFLP